MYKKFLMLLILATAMFALPPRGPSGTLPNALFAGEAEAEKKPSSEPSPTLPEEKKEITWKTSWEEAAKAAKAENKYIIILATDPSRCPPCVTMEKNTWPDPDVVAFVMEKFVPLLAKGSRTPLYGEMRQAFPFRGIPSVIVADADKKKIAMKSGAMGSADLIKFLKAALSVDGLEKAGKEKPDDATAVAGLAECYAELGRDKEAKELFEKVLELDSDNKAGMKPKALFHLGELLLGELSRRRRIPLPTDKRDALMKEAEDKLQEALKLDPEDKAGLREDASYDLAFLPLLKDDTDTALGRFEKFIKDFPKSDNIAVSVFWTAQIYAKHKQYDKSISAFERIEKEFPKSRYARYVPKAIQHLKAWKKAEAEKKAKEDADKKEKKEEKKEDPPEEDDEFK